MDVLRERHRTVDGGVTNNSCQLRKGQNHEAAEQ